MAWPSGVYTCMNDERLAAEDVVWSGEEEKS